MKQSFRMVRTWSSRAYFEDLHEAIWDLAEQVMLCRTDNPDACKMVNALQ